MNVDLRHTLTDGINNLMTWRNRYDSSQYPEKVVQNIFYRKYAMELMFPEILECFKKSLFGQQKKRWNDFSQGFHQLKSIYSTTATQKAQPGLLNVLSQHDRNIGNTNHGIFLPLISAAKRGDSAKLEEIEYAYLYYLLADECVLLWAAFGGTGMSKIDVIGRMSGLLIEVEDIKTYSASEQVLGQLCAAPYLKEHYKALPVNV